MQAEETKMNIQQILDTLDASQGVIEKKAYDVLNETDKLANMILDIMKELEVITLESSEEEKNKAVTHVKDLLPIVLEHVFIANEVSHDLEEKAEEQKEAVDNIQYVMDYLLSI